MINQMDSRYFNSDHMPADTFNDMFTKSDHVAQIKQDLHITKPGDFVKTCSDVSDNLADREDNYAWIYSWLLDQGIKIIINVGQFDMKDGVVQTE